MYIGMLSIMSLASFVIGASKKELDESTMAKQIKDEYVVCILMSYEIGKNFKDMCNGKFAYLLNNYANLTKRTSLNIEAIVDLSTEIESKHDSFKPQKSSSTTSTYRKKDCERLELSTNPINVNAMNEEEESETESSVDAAVKDSRNNKSKLDRLGASRKRPCQWAKGIKIRNKIAKSSNEDEAMLEDDLKPSICRKLDFDTIFTCDTSKTNTPVPFAVNDDENNGELIYQKENTGHKGEDSRNELDANLTNNCDESDNLSSDTDLKCYSDSYESSDEGSYSLGSVIDDQMETDLSPNLYSLQEKPLDHSNQLDRLRMHINLPTILIVVRDDLGTKAILGNEYTYTYVCGKKSPSCDEIIAICKHLFPEVFENLFECDRYTGITIDFFAATVDDIAINIINESCDVKLDYKLDYIQVSFDIDQKVNLPVKKTSSVLKSIYNEKKKTAANGCEISTFKFSKLDLRSFNTNKLRHKEENALAFIAENVFSPDNCNEEIFRMIFDDFKLSGKNAEKCYLGLALSFTQKELETWKTMKIEEWLGINDDQKCQPNNIDITAKIYRTYSHFLDKPNARENTQASVLSDKTQENKGTDKTNAMNIESAKNKIKKLETGTKWKCPFSYADKTHDKLKIHVNYYKYNGFEVSYTTYTFSEGKDAVYFAVYKFHAKNKHTFDIILGGFVGTIDFFEYLYKYYNKSSSYNDHEIAEIVENLYDHCFMHLDTN